MKNLISIQSHVSHGYVGGRAATFPLQTLGWDVDNINTVNFSNHTGYGQVKGAAIDANQLNQLFQGLINIQILGSYNAAITGYIPNDELIQAITKYVKMLKQNSDLLYLLDPVMGDQGFLYVNESCIQQYKSLITENIVDIITPNQFELELLCDFKINNKSDLINGINCLSNIKYVIITSLYDNLNLFPNEKDLLYVAFRENNQIKLFKIPVIKSYFTGVGDLFSALLIDKIYSNASLPNCLEISINQALTIMSNVLQLTHKLGMEAYCNAHNLPLTYDSSLIQSQINDADTMRFFELKLIQSKPFFEYPGPGVFKCYNLP
ncbi:Ribokinase-like protein [Hyphopichia burtonii NRRL Y-1933]|uniref:pyridoxal kinase n=1 Tax=Hyphopichia burtonii NRRL Y-1933 TaxID=984485 RepID=A0A1E4RCQ1_9ASCO|nr:Ribokinase-like protein [Hyphopichia burtonii NRRL Y-1933]ODV65048.1 Ribokinase-like protein [Hyphopichia burtonii NRRL Y-1933]